MNSASTSTRALATGILFFLAVGMGIAVAQFLPPDLFGLRGSRSTVEEAGLYTCAMHPHILLHEPGECPICGMELVPVGGPASAGEHSAADGVEPPPGTATPRRASREREVLFYRNPMDPTITSPVPAKDSMGMDYVPVFADETTDMGAMVQIDPSVIQTMNVRVQPVERRDLEQSIRTVGFLEYDQQRMVTVTTKYTGFIEKVYVNYIGEEVRRGQPLFEIYSPELVQTEQDLLSALEFARKLEETPGDARRRADSLVDSARERLAYWDISLAQIEKLEATGKVFRTLVVSSPADGLVMKRLAGLEGMAAQPGMELFHIADLSSLWVSVELFENQIAWVREGTMAKIELSYFPGETFRGAVRYLEPELSDRTRTIRAKIEIPNRNGKLRTGMYATVEFNPVLVEDAISVPSEAVIRTGTRNVVVVALGEGRFAPREVRLGLEAQGQIQILSGLEEGLDVVTSAQFLLDSESKLREAIQKMVASRS